MFWSPSVAKEIKHNWIVIAFFSFLVMLIFKIKPPANMNIKEFFTFFLILGLIGLLWETLSMYSWQEKSPDEKRKKIIKNYIKNLTWVEGEEVSWEYKITKIIISQYPTVEIKRLTPICNSHQKALSLTIGGSRYECECGREIPLKDVKVIEKLIIDGLCRRIIKINEPIEKPEDKPDWKKFEVYIKDV